MKNNFRLFSKLFVASLLAAFALPFALQAETVPFTSSALGEQEQVSIKSGTSTSTQPGYGIEKSFDGNKSTLYHSTWGSTSFPVTLTYYLTTASNIDYFIYNTRMDGSSNGNFREFDVRVREAGTTTFTKVLTKNLNGASGSWKVFFDTTQVNIDAVQFYIRTGAGDGNGFAACTEMEFYKLKEGAFNPLSIFTDAACTTLKTGVTRDNINAINNPFYKQLALDLLDQSYTTEFRIQHYKAWPHPDDFSRNNRVGTYSLCDNPTGIFVRQGDTVIVMVDDIYDVPVSLTLKNYNKPGGNGYWENSYYGLSKGANRIVADRDGLFYVFYHSTALHTTVPQVKIHFAYGKVNGYFDSEKHSAADWSRILSATKYEYFDALGKYAHLSYPTAHFKKNALTSGPQLVANYNELVQMQREFMGYYKFPNRDPKNRSHFVVMYHSYMYSTSYHTGYEVGTMDGLTNATNVRKYPWGPAHEVGHSNQHTPLLRWIGTTEVTNNIQSLLVQTTWGNPSRLTEENRYQAAFEEIIIGGAAHGQANIWHKLVSMWQLELFFNRVLGRTDFYASIYEGARKRPTGSNHGEYQLNFVKLVADSAKADLTEFFEAWGYLKPINISVEDYSTAQLTITTTQSNATKQYIKNKNFEVLPYKIQYITDTNWELYKNKATVEKGSAALFGNSMRLSGWKNAVAYEAWQGSKLVNISQSEQISFPGAYTDSTKIYAIQYDGTRIEIEPKLAIIQEQPRISDETNEYWYIVKNMGTESSNNNSNRSFTSLTAGSNGAVAGASTLPVLKTQKWKLVNIDGKTGLVNEAGLYLGSDFRATSTPFGWTLESVSQGGSTGYRFANYTGSTLSSVAHLSTSLSLMNYTENDAASVWQFIPANSLTVSNDNLNHPYIIRSMRIEADVLGSSINYNNETNTVTSQPGANAWSIVNYNATSGACNLRSEDGKYLNFSGSNLALSETPRTFYIYLTSLDGVVGYRISLNNYSGSTMVNMTNTGTLNSSTTLSMGSLWQFSPIVTTGTSTSSIDSLHAYARDGKIHVDGADRFEVFMLNGQRINNNNLANGIYLVKTPATTLKVIVTN